MTNTEAIKLIRCAQAEIEWEQPMEYVAAFDKAIDALELLKEQGPLKVLQDRQCEVAPSIWQRKGFCPECHQEVQWVINRNFCGFCGRAVKWNEYSS